jgi:hypothetical protein
LNEYFLDEQQLRRKERSFTMRRKKDGCWRYQAVYIEREIGENEKVKEYSICEIYLDKDEKLEMWTENPSIAPYGLSHDELVGSLHLMLEDVEKWEAVPFDSLCIGMAFDRKDISSENE